MSDFTVKLGKFNIKIKKGDNIEDVKKKLGENIAAAVFEGFNDENEKGKLDTDAELETLKGKFKEQEIEIIEAEKKQGVAPDGKTPRNAYAKAIDNMKNRYGENLKDYFDTAEENKVTIKKGDKLWNIAKEALIADGFEEPSQKDINNRIAQIASLNNINNVNNIPLGTELIVRLNEIGKNAVNADENKDSAVALGGSPKPAVENGKEVKKNDDKKTENVDDKEAVKADGKEAEKAGEKKAEKAEEKEEEESRQEVPEAFVSQLGDSPFTVSANGLDMGRGIPVDAEGNELKREDAFKKDSDANKAFKAAGAVMKYKKGDEVMYQITFLDNTKTAILRGVKLYAKSIQELKEMKESIKAEANKIKKVTDNMDDETKAATVQANVAALRAIITASNGNSKVIENAVTYMRDAEYMGDFKSEDVKSLTKDLLLTKDAGVVSALMTNNRLFENDETALDTAAQMFKELRQRELNGEKLSKEENELKEVLANAIGNISFVETEELELGESENKNKVTRKTEKSFDEYGNTYYFANVDDNEDGAPGRYAKAETKEALDTFWREFCEVATRTEEEKALFKKYAEAVKNGETVDKYIIEALLNKCNGELEDKKTLINKCGLDVLTNLDADSMDAYVKIAVINRIRKIYTGVGLEEGEQSTAGNLDNARYLGKAFDFIHSCDALEGRFELKQEIVDSYFTISGEGDEMVATFEPKPSRRPTKAEMQGLLQALREDMYEGDDYALRRDAILACVKAEDIGEGQYTEILQDKEYTNKTYAKFVENMQTVDDAIEFISKIKNHAPQDSIPFDALIEQFKGDTANFPKLARVLIKYMPVVNDEIISVTDDNRLAVLQTLFPKDEEGKVNFDKSKLPDGITLGMLLAALPVDCKEGDAKLYHEAFVKAMGPEDIIDNLGFLKNKGNTAFLKQHIYNVCKSQITKEGNKWKCKPFAYELMEKFGAKDSYYDILPWSLYVESTTLVKQIMEKLPDDSSRRAFANNFVAGLSDDEDRIKLVNKNANIYILEALANYHFNHPSDDMYKKLVATGFITEVENNVFVYNKECCVNGYGTVFYEKTNENKIEVIQNGNFAQNMYKNIDSDDDKPRQIAYAKELGNMSPENVAYYYQAYFDVGGEGLLEALDYELNGASMSEFVPIIAKIAKFAEGKQKDNRKIQDKYNSLMELVKSKNKYFVCDENGVPTQPLQVSAKWKDDDFDDFSNDAEKFDNALKELLEACNEAK